MYRKESLHSNENIRFVSSVILQNLSFPQTKNSFYYCKLSNHIIKIPNVLISFMNVLRHDEKKIYLGKVKRIFLNPFPFTNTLHTVHFNDGRKSMGKNNENKQCSKKTFFRSREPNVYSIHFH